MLLVVGWKGSSYEEGNEFDAWRHTLHHHLTNRPRQRRRLTSYLVRAGSSARVLPPKAFRPNLPLRSICRAEGDARNGARMAEHATAAAAVLAASEPQDVTLYVNGRVERRSESEKSTPSTPNRKGACVGGRTIFSFRCKRLRLVPPSEKPGHNNKERPYLWGGYGIASSSSSGLIVMGG